MLTKEERNDLHSLLERMYQLNGEDTFSGLVSKIWRILGVKGECNVMAFEKALIDIIDNFTAPKESHTPHKKKSKAKRHDSLLLMFGLLDGEGYYHTELDESNGMISVTSDERIFRYVKQSDYKKLGSERQKKDDKLCEEAIYKAHRREIMNERYFFDFLINRIDEGKTDKKTDKKPFQEYVQKYIDSPPETIELPDGRRRIVLPQPSYTLKKFPPGNKTKNNNCADNSVKINDGAPNNLSAGDNETTYTSAPDEVIKGTLQNDLEKLHKQESQSGSIRDVFSSVAEQEKESSRDDNSSQKPKNKIKSKHKIGLFALCVITIIVAIVVFISRKKANTYSPMEYTPQNRIVNIDEPDIDNVEEVFDEIKELIVRNPCYGDMVARGLRDLGERVTNNNSWINDFIEKTDIALDLPSYKHPRGLEYWLTYREGEGNTQFITEEYFDYSTRIFMMLKKCFTIVGIREWECSESWKIPRRFESSDDFAKKRTDTVIQSALVLQELDEFSEEPQFIIGFSLEEGRFLIYDPEVVYQ